MIPSLMLRYSAQIQTRSLGTASASGFRKEVFTPSTTVKCDLQETTGEYVRKVYGISPENITHLFFSNVVGLATGDRLIINTKKYEVVNIPIASSHIEAILRKLV